MIIKGLMKLFFFVSLYLPFCSSFLQNRNGFRQVAYTYREPTDIPRKRYIIDIDGTICSKTNSEYNKSKPNFENIDIFNHLYVNGFEVHYWTARGALSGINWDEFTVQQLESWNVKYDSINMGKPHYDVWVDDKAINARDFCDSIEVDVYD